MWISRGYAVLYVIFPLCVLASWKKHEENEVLRVTQMPTTQAKQIKGNKTTPSRWLWSITITPRPVSVLPAKSSVGHDRYPSAPIHGHHWPFDKDSVPPGRPVSGSYSIEGTFLWAVGLFGTVENGAVVLTMLCSKRTGRPLNVLVGFVSVADLYITMVYIPSYTYFMLERGINTTGFGRQLPAGTKSQRSPVTFCHVSRWIFLETASVALSLQMLIALYLLVFTRSRKMAARVFSSRNVFLLIVSSWLINGVIYFLPGELGGATLDLYPEMFTCDVGDPADKSFLVASAPSAAMSAVRVVYREVVLSLHLIQLSVICASFAKVHDAIRTGRTISLSRQEQDHDKPATYLRATKATSAIFILLAFFWIPNYLLSLLDPWYQVLPHDVHRATFDLLLTKSAVNPLIYIYGLRSLRHEVKLFCMCRCRSDRGTANMFRPSSTSGWSNDDQQQTRIVKERMATVVK